MQGQICADHYLDSFLYFMSKKNLRRFPEILRIIRNEYNLKIAIRIKFSKGLGFSTMFSCKYQKETV